MLSTKIDVRRSSSRSSITTTVDADRRGTEKQTEATRAKGTIWSYIRSEDIDSVTLIFHK
jgi:hypothetical protein